MVNAIVYAIDNDPAMLESLSWIIDSIGFKVKMYTRAQSFLDEYNPKSPGCILLDVRMPGMSGSELQVKLKELEAQGTSIPPIIFISGYADVSLAVQTMKAGAFDFITKPFNTHQLLETINRAIRLDHENRCKIQQSVEAHARFASLSVRETEVLQGILAGKVNKVISAELNISSKTVEVHRASLMKKMAVKSVSELVQLVLSNNVQETLQGMIFLFNSLLLSDKTV